MFLGVPQYSDDFISGLKKLRLVSDGQNQTGLVFVNQNSSSISPAEQFSIEKAKELKATAVYFRRYNNRPSIPQIYVYDFSTVNPTEEELAEINKGIWSSSAVPLAYIFLKADLTIIDCTKPIKQQNEVVSASYLIKHLSLVSVISRELEKYSAELFDTGLFWEENENLKKFSFRNSAYEKLLDYLKHVRKTFVEKSDISDTIAQKLIVQSILLKYLEEREDIQGNKVFPIEYFNKYNRAKNFCGVLRSKGQCIRLFDDLNKNKFNGKIFEWSDKKERSEIEKNDLSCLADFLDGESNVQGQLSFWRQYSFSYLPVELISRIYEEFLGNNKDGLVYTPPHLVNFLIDECLPLNVKPQDISLDIKIFDPSCGSGIFLVSAFKRLVQLWRIKHSMKKPSIQSLKKILRECIYGVDIEKDAVQLTTFSLSLAICDLLTPTEIWHELKFDNLKEENICSSDFFDWTLKNSNKKFDFIIGNPPFVRGGLQNDQFWEIEPDRKISIPQNQIALKFLSDSMALLKEGGLQCLILPAGNLFYNSTSKEFRKEFFNRYHVVQVLDFSCLARNHVLWDNAEVATAVVFTRNTKPDFKKNVLHVTIRRTKASAERILFEIDDYDLHYIRRDAAATVEFVWKANLLGGGRTYDLIQKFADLITIKEFIDKNNFIAGEGYIIGTGGTKSSSFMSGLPALPTEAFDEEGINYQALQVQKAKKFVKTSDDSLYKAPNILIKENIGTNRIPIAFNRQSISFKHKIISIKSLNDDLKELKKLFDFFNSSMDIYRFLIFVKSGQILLNKNTAFLKEDFMNLPLSENLKSFSLTQIEKNILHDTLTYYQEFFRHGENSIVLRPIQNANKELIKEFSDSFLSILNPFFSDNGNDFYTKEIFFGSAFIAVHFSYGKNTTKPNWVDISNNFSREALEKMFSWKISDHLFSKRIIKIYKEDSVILIKPNQLRFWLKTMAYRDADKVFADLANRRK
jgi:hypothetical protein